MMSHLLIIDHNACTTQVLFRKSFSVPMSSSVSLPYLTQGIRSYIEVLDPLELSFV